MPPQSRPVYSPKQADVLLNADARWNLLVGATRSGKTFITYDLLLKRMIRQPPGACMLIGKTIRTLERNVLVPMRERFGDAHVGRISVDGTVELFGRTCYVVGANDEKAVHKIQGAGLVYAYGDEFATWPEKFFSMLKSRLDKPGAKFDGTCNPEGPNHWAKKTLIDKAGELDLKYWHFVLEDNLFLPKDFVENLKAEYAGTVWYDRYIKGLWVAAEGVVYPMWDETKHVVGDKDLPRDRHGYLAFERYWIACDYGDQNPTRFLLIGLAENKFWVLAEYHHSGRESNRPKTLAQYSRDLSMFMDMHIPDGYVPERIWVDPAASAFITQLMADRARDRRLGRVAQANNAVLDGIRATGSLLGSGRILVHHSCKHLINEMTAYVWDEKAAEQGKDEPVKQNDHSLDALRYHVNGTKHIWLRWIKKGAVA